jgi:transcriptional regulator with XRE-family HTH domain
MTGEELKFLREYLGMSQMEFADRLGKSQKTISLWESSPNVPIKGEVEETLKAILRERRPDDTDRLDHLPLISKEYSWGEKIFELLRKDWADRGRPFINKIIVKSTISPVREKKIGGIPVPPEQINMFADCTVDIEYIGCEMDSNRSLFLDHLGNEEGPFSKLPTQTVLTSRDNASVSSDAHKREPVPVPIGVTIEAAPALCELDKNVNKEIGPHAVAYEFSGVNKFYPIKVNLDVMYGLKRSSTGFIGFPVYADILIHLLYIEVRFTDGLQPENGVVFPKALVVRRTKFKPENLASDFPERKGEIGEGNSLTYRFGPLVRPRGGYFYCLSFGAIEEV